MAAIESSDIQPAASFPFNPLHCRWVSFETLYFVNSNLFRI